jgi:arabinose-5-phosphate isomerase
LRQQAARDAMTPHPVTIAASSLAAEALHVLEQRKITSVVVVDAGRKVEGVVHLHDLWRTELF